ncbi:amino acid racemase [Geoglobus acetivorans]|uniref:Amino acid racemase n=1 Tax=Geoglobus acetivorans TaxID=565033 RepID=A0ABZ3H418_GEOAI|nr:amino acid racemase [Geoglobus acetivorans]
MKRIGIIGGLSPESTLYYYQEFIRLSRENFESNVYPEMVIYSINFSEFLNSDWETRLKILSSAVKSLERAGAELLAIASNTPHKVLPELEKIAESDFVSIIDAVAERAREIGAERLLLTGTRTTMKEGFYRKELEKSGFEVTIPEEVEEINSIIFEDLVFGNLQRKNRLVEIINKYDADAVILGCTELPIAISEGDVKMNVIDSAREHVRLILRKAIE